MNKSNRKKVRRWLVPILLTFFVWCIFRWVLFVGYVPTESMEPTIPRGSIVLAVRNVRKIRPGEIVVFLHERKMLIKRITVIYEKGETVAGFYVLGDNQNESLDSRFWEYPLVFSSVLIGRVFAVM